MKYRHFNIVAKNRQLDIFFFFFDNGIMDKTNNSRFNDELMRYSTADWQECLKCDECTAVCSIEENGKDFIKNIATMIRSDTDQEIKNDLSPWFCYYCGDCRETCAKNLVPGEIMMSLRRYLTASYDWTGLSRRLYRSVRAHLFLIATIFSAILGSFLLFADYTIPLKNGIVQINAFAPVKTILIADEVLLVVLSIFLLSNIFIMYRRIILDQHGLKIPIKLYLTQIQNAGIQFLTQLKFAKCKRKRLYWINHLLIMSSYIIMFTIIAFFLYWFQTEKVYPVTHPQRWLGYYVAFGFLFSIIYFAFGRIRKKEPVFMYTHHSDWIFLFLLFMIALTGLMLHLFRINGMATEAYILYTLHLSFEVPMVVTFVAFSKWSHLAYRPFAIYFKDLRDAALKEQRKS